jgi:predicted RNA-binding protein with PUA-like domain
MVRAKASEEMRVATWLMKSEPGAYSWDDLVRDKRTHWDGVRNHQAANNMKAMRKGDRAFFYHSVTDKTVVGVMEVVKEYYPDHTDASGRFGMVDVKALKPVKQAVSLAEIKAEPRLADLALVRQSRLSVVPVSDDHWALLCEMAGIKA